MIANLRKATINENCEQRRSEIATLATAKPQSEFRRSRHQQQAEGRLQDHQRHADARPVETRVVSQSESRDGLRAQTRALLSTRPKAVRLDLEFLHLERLTAALVALAAAAVAANRRRSSRTADSVSAQSRLT